MINLLPKPAQKSVVREYVFRIISVCMLALAFLAFAFAMLTTPTDVLILSLKNNVSANLNDAKAAEDSYHELLQVVDDTNQLINYLHKKEETFSSELVSTIDELTGGNVVINEFNFGGEVGTITITGMADSRAALSQFRNAIEGSEQFVAVELPLSNLAKDTDVSFTMTLALNDLKK